VCTSKCAFRACRYRGCTLGMARMEGLDKVRILESQNRPMAT